MTSVTIQCIRRTDNMNLLSLNEDARRKSPRKSVGQMPHYMAREYNEQKGGRREEVRRWCEEAGEKETHIRKMIAIQVLNQ